MGPTSADVSPVQLTIVLMLADSLIGYVVYWGEIDKKTSSNGHPNL
jgi:hypothetical protein